MLSLYGNLVIVCGLLTEHETNIDVVVVVC